MHHRCRQMAVLLYFCSVSVVLHTVCWAHCWAQTPQTENTFQLDADAKPAQVELTKLKFLVGRWVGTGLGGECEEVFLPLWNDTMTGCFRYARDGKLVFSEYFSFDQSDEGVVLRLKHFHPDLVGWEEKDGMVKFPLIKVEENAAYFGGLTYRLVNPDELHIWVAMRDRTTGTLRDEAFVLKRAPL